MLFLMNKIFIFVSFIFRKKIIQSLQLKNYFLYFLVLLLIFKPNTALCEDTLFNNTDGDNNSSNKKIIFYSLLFLTVVGVCLFFYLYNENTDYPDDYDYSSDWEPEVNIEKIAKKIAEDEADAAYAAAQKIAKAAAIEKFNETEMYVRFLRKRGGYSFEEMDRALENRDNAVQALTNVHDTNPHYIYRPFTERRIID